MHRAQLKLYNAMRHAEIQMAIRRLKSDIEARAACEMTSPTCSVDQAVRLEESICLSTRALFSRYIDSAKWEGIDPDEEGEVGAVLKQALEHLKLDQDCIISVRHRCQDFQKFRDASDLAVETYLTPATMPVGSPTVLAPAG